MKTTALAAASVALCAMMPGDAFAKGPVAVDAQNSLLVLAKETKHTDIDFKDFPFGLEEGRTENVRLSFEQVIEVPEEEGSANIKYVLTMPWLDVEKDGDDVTITYPESMTMAVHAVSPDDEKIDVEMDMESEDTVMTFTRDGDRMTYTGSSKSFSANMETPEALTKEGKFNYTMSGKNMVIEGAGAAEQDWTDLASLDVEYDYTMDSVEFAFDIESHAEGDEVPPISVTGKTGKVAAAGKMGQGVLKGGGSGSDMTLNVLKPMPMEFFFGKFRSDMSMPTEPSPDPQPFRYLIAAEDVQVDEQVWAMVDPGEAFPRELNEVVIDIEMMARLFVSFLDPAAIAEAEEKGMPPMMPTGVKINSIAFDGLGLIVDAEGEGELKGATPDAAGSISIKGLSDFVKSAIEVGAFDEQEAMMVEGMAKQFGKEGENGELLFEFKTEGGMVVVNGTPVAPLPGPGAQ